MPDSKKLPQL
jgi:hypothetical protein